MAGGRDTNLKMLAEKEEDVNPEMLVEEEEDTNPEMSAMRRKIAQLKARKGEPRALAQEAGSSDQGRWASPRDDITASSGNPGAVVRGTGWQQLPHKGGMAGRHEQPSVGTMHPSKPRKTGSGSREGESLYGEGGFLKRRLEVSFPDERRSGLGSTLQEPGFTSSMVAAQAHQHLDYH
ncbi:hypothetical protein Y1Q_0007288 [Alligator mississippiensis]|uniref:Uncharacterized protein n=1 Tax=Alligator mississippiensis TaxID=8496 RepID=A0A151NN08_ALLMI|nr:hypothetical protein Y1Q_0007288 [Alligator mississippiensis]